MVNKVGFPRVNLETLIAVSIAVASLVTALVAWRTNLVSTQASGTNRAGLIAAIKNAAAAGEDWRKVYEEAGYARDYLIEEAAVSAMEASSGRLNTVTAGNMRQFLLTNLARLAEPMGTAPGYRKPDGTFDAQKRFLEVHVDGSDPPAPTPEALFKLAASIHQEQRFLSVGLVLLAASLFWLGMAEISPKRTRLIWLVIGAGGFLVTLGYVAVVEAIFFLIQRSL